MHLPGGQAEQEEVLRAHLLADLDVRAVERADRQRAVQRELHVAGPARLLARRGDLLRQVGRRIDVLRVLHVEVREEHHLQPAAHVGVVVHDAPPTAWMSLMISLAMK